MPPSFLELQKRVDSNFHRRAASAASSNHAPHDATNTHTRHPRPSSPTSPSALRHLLKREVFMSDPTISASVASERAQLLASTKRGSAHAQGKSVSLSPLPTGHQQMTKPNPVSGTSTSTATGGAARDSSFSYRSSFNLNAERGSGSAVRTIVKDPHPSQKPSSVFRRECRLELFVRREAVFYNYLLTMSNTMMATPSSSDAGAIDIFSASVNQHNKSDDSGDACEVSLTSVAAAQGIVSAQVDQPSMLSLLWNVSQVAKTSHLTGGDGTFFLRKEFIGGDGATSPSVKQQSGGASSNSSPLEPHAITVHNILKLFGNERTFHTVPHNHHHHQLTAVSDHQRQQPLFRSTSYLLTESYECTLAEYLRAQTARGHVDAVIVFEWCRVVAIQLAQLHRVGVLHNNIHADSIVLCKDHTSSKGMEVEIDNHDSGDAASSSGSTSKHFNQPHGNFGTTSVIKAPGSELVAKLSWLYCASMQDLQVVRGLRKQTLSQSRADPVHSEYHTLNTQHLPTELTTLAKTYSSVLPPEWFSFPRTAAGSEASGGGGGGASSPHNRSTVSLQRHASILAPTEASHRNSPTHQSTTGSGGGGEEAGQSNEDHYHAKLRNIVVPTEKSDAFLFGKLLQQIFTGTMVEFNPQSVLSVSSHYLSKGPSQMGLFSDCPTKIGKLARVDEISSECLRHLITAATIEDRDVRWTIKEISDHPFFWRSETIIEFMQCVIEFAFPVSGPAVENPTGTTGSESSAQKQQQVAAAVNQTNAAKMSLRESFREVVQKSQSQQQTKKLNFTAPELSNLRGISKQLSTWVVEPRNWITQDVNMWVEELCLEARDHGGAVRTMYENLNHQHVEFLVNVYMYLHHKRRIPSIVDGGDAATFVSVFLNRMFPTLLMETISMVLNVDDAPKFAIYVASKIRQNWVLRRKRASIPHLQSILSLAESLCREKSKTIVATGYDHVVQYVGAFPQFPVHIAESERVQVSKKSSGKDGKAAQGASRRSGGKPNLSNLPKWAQIQIAAADADIQQSL